MAIGDIDIQKFTIGSINVLDPSVLSLIGFNIYEDILNPLGPVGEARVYDYQDTLGKNNISGKEAVSITFGIPSRSGSSTFNFKLFQNKNLSDQSENESGSMHSKYYDLRFVSPEMLNAQGNYVSKSYNALTSDMVKQILKNNMKTTDDIHVDTPTKTQRTLVFHNEHPVSVLRKLNNLHVSSKNASSCYTVYKTISGGKTVYKINEFEELFKQSPVVNLRQTTTLAVSSSDSDKQNSIMWFTGGDSFQTLTRAASQENLVGYDHSTGITYNKSSAAQTPKVLGQPVYNKPPITTSGGVPMHTAHDSINTDARTYVAEAKSARLAFLSHLSQNSAELEVPGNPAITLGSVINLSIPKKANEDNESGETQLNGKGLVVSIRHKIKPLGQTPRYTMILRVVKAGYDQQGGGNG